jgi:hypothetical protein
LEVAVGGLLRQTVEQVVGQLYEIGHLGEAVLVIVWARVKRPSRKDRRSAMR